MSNDDHDVNTGSTPYQQLIARYQQMVNDQPTTVEDSVINNNVLMEIARLETLYASYHEDEEGIAPPTAEAPGEFLTWLTESDEHRWAFEDRLQRRTDSEYLTTQVPPMLLNNMASLRTAMRNTNEDVPPLPPAPTVSTQVPSTSGSPTLSPFATPYTPPPLTSALGGPPLSPFATPYSPPPLPTTLGGPPVLPFATPLP